MSQTIEAITKHRGIPSEKNQTMGCEVLIRVYAAGVNPVDCAIRAGRVQELFPVSFSWIPGWDLSGVVEEVGADVTKFNKGDERKVHMS